MTAPDLQPDPRFVQFLEWQLASEQRRLAAFSDGAATRARPRKTARMTGIAALVFASACLGAAGTYAAVRIDDAALRTLLLTKADILREQALLRFETVSRELEQMKPFVDDGLVSPSELDELRCRLAAAETDLRARELDAEEVALSGVAPRDDLGAPPLDGRDFVLDRIEAQTKAAHIFLDRHQKSLARMTALADGGAVTRMELAAAEHDLKSAAATLRHLDRRRELRAAFLAGTLSGEDAELLGLADEAAAGIEEAQRELERAQRSFDRVNEQAEVGAVTGTELRRAQTHVQMLERYLRLAELERELVERRLDPQGQDHDE